MVLETRELHVCIRRTDDEGLGLRLAVADGKMWVDAMIGTRIKEWNQRCRSCGVKEIRDQELFEMDQVMCVNGETELLFMLKLMSDPEVLICHIRFARHANPVEELLAAAAFTRQAHNAGIEVEDTGGSPMQPPNSTLVPSSLPHLATPQRAQHRQSIDFSGIASVPIVKGIGEPFNFAATAEAAAAAAAQAGKLSPQMPNGIEPYRDHVAPSEPALSAGPPAEEQQQQQQQPAAPPVVAPRGPSQSRVIENYDPPNEEERGYLGVVVGTLVTVQAGSRAAPEERNRYRCDYVFAWKTDDPEQQGWVPERVLDVVPE